MHGEGTGQAQGWKWRMDVLQPHKSCHQVLAHAQSMLQMLCSSFIHTSNESRERSHPGRAREHKGSRPRRSHGTMVAIQGRRMGRFRKLRCLNHFELTLILNCSQSFKPRFGSLLARIHTCLPIEKKKTRQSAKLTRRVGSCALKKRDKKLPGS